MLATKLDNYTDPETYKELPGAILLSGLLQTFFLGCVFGQAVKYWREYPLDSITKRLFVLIVVLLSLAQTIAEDAKLWVLGIERQYFSTGPLLWLNYFITGLICALCQAFFIRRCWTFTGRKKWILYPMSVLLITITVANLFTTINLALIVRNAESDEGVERTERIMIPLTWICFTYWIFASVALDVCLASILSIYLWRSRTGFKSSNQIINHVIRLTCESALGPCLLRMMAVIIYYASPNPSHEENIVICLLLLTGKLYTYGLLRTLNSRGGLRNRMHQLEGGIGRATLGTWTWNQRLSYGGGKQVKRSASVPDLTINRTFGSVSGEACVIPTHESPSAGMVYDEKATAFVQAIPALASGRDLRELQSPRRKTASITEK